MKRAWIRPTFFSSSSRRDDAAAAAPDDDDDEEDDDDDNSAAAADVNDDNEEAAGKAAPDDFDTSGIGCAEYFSSGLARMSFMTEPSDPFIQDTDEGSFININVLIEDNTSCIHVEER